MGGRRDTASFVSQPTNDLDIETLELFEELELKNDDFVLMLVMASLLIFTYLRFQLEWKYDIIHS